VAWNDPGSDLVLMSNGLSTPTFQSVNSVLDVANNTDDRFLYRAGGVWFGVQPADEGTQETGSNTVRPVTPATPHFHRSALKGWAVVPGNSTTPVFAWNVSTISDNAVGDMTVTWNSSQTAGSTLVMGQSGSSSALGDSRFAHFRNSTGSGQNARCLCWNGNNPMALADPENWHFVRYGEL
jgi:hypothetical protein